ASPLGRDSGEPAAMPLPGWLVGKKAAAKGEVEVPAIALELGDEKGEACVAAPPRPWVAIATVAVAAVAREVGTTAPATARRAASWRALALASVAVATCWLCHQPPPASVARSRLAAIPQRCTSRRRR
nr:hypothetical protein [Tanacetum cinerariifolium]